MHSHFAEQNSPASHCALFVHLQELSDSAESPSSSPTGESDEQEQPTVSHNANVNAYNNPINPDRSRMNGSLFLWPSNLDRNENPMHDAKACVF